MHCNRQDIEDLAERGLRLDKRRRSFTTRGGTPKVDAGWWEFDVTSAGFQRIDGLARAAAPAARAGQAGLQWETDVLPVLVAAYAVSSDSDPDQGISADAVSERLGREATDPETGRILISLVDAGWIIPVITNVSGRVGPHSFRLGEKALQEVAGWPTAGSGDRFVEQLLAVLDERIAGAQGEERSRLERLRG